jgi:hypothetical protein
MKKANFIVIVLLSLIICSCGKDSITGNSSSGNASSNGSLTRFTTVGNYLYIVDISSLNTFDISNPASPVFKNKTEIGFNIETIIPYGDKLFIGSNQSMFIYSLANPENPTKISTVQYFVRGRDPIVVKDTVAYSTLRNIGTGGNLNVFNIKNPLTPAFVGSLGLSSPYGLGIKDSALYICEGAVGLRVFSIYKPHVPVFKKLLTANETFYDVIVENNILICYIKGGVYLYDVTDIFNPIYISFIKN